jgi:hypothetical protein
MRYKIVKEKQRNESVIHESYYVMKEVKRWYHRKPVWRYCREFTYASYDSWSGEYVRRKTLKEAEDYIRDMMKADVTDLQPEEIRIYECRDTKLDKILD